MQISDTKTGRYPWDLVILTLIISTVGVVLINSATNNKANLDGVWEKQLIVLCAGFVGMMIISRINYRILLKLSWPIYILSIFALIVVYIYGRVGGGAKSWINLAGFSIQPSEFTKLALILILAQTFAALEQSNLGLKELIRPGIILVIPLALTAIQPDLGTAITMVPLLFGVALVAGMRFRSIVAIILIFIFLTGFAWMFLLKDYQKERVRSFFNPGDDPRNSGYQIQQSRIAIGSGGLFGKGLYLGSQSQLNFVPAQHTDFIFSVLGEEMGFISVVVVLLVYLLLYGKPLFSLRKTHDLAGIYIVVAVISYLSFQTVINVLMSIGLFPTTGVPLPFLSAGGSALLTNMAAMGLVMSVFANSDKEV
jgi:rod shape determining protein RodA